MRASPWLAVLLVAGGCGTGEGAAYILLDAQARAARVELAVDGRTHGGALPVEVDPVQLIELRTPSGRRRLAVASGMFYEVRGVAGTTHAWTLGEEVRTDLVGVSGPDDAVRGLASALGSRGPERWNGRWQLQGADALIRLAWMGDLPDIKDVAVVPTEAGQARALAGLARLMSQPDVPATPIARAGNSTLPGLVGFYAGDANLTLFLDAEGNYVLERCSRDRRIGQYYLRQGRLELDGTDLAFQITGNGRLEAPGLGLSLGGEP